MTIFIRCMEHLEKVAFGPEAMGKVFNRFKQIQVKSPELNSFMGGMGGKKGVDMAMGQMQRLGLPKEVMTAAKPQVEAGLSVLRKSGPTAITPPRGDATQFYRGQGGQHINPAAFDAIQKSPGNRKALDAVTKGHELAESTVNPGISMTAHGHRSPEVILREHNMIQTLPKENAPVGDFMRSARAMGGELGALRQATGFQYGQGPRISRHARKHLTNMMEAEGTKNFQNALASGQISF